MMLLSSATLVSAALLIGLVLAGEVRAQEPAAEPLPIPRIASTVDVGSYRPLTKRERWRYYWEQNYTSPAVAACTFGTALRMQLDDRPGEWGQGAAGYSRRVASTFGRYTLAGSFQNAGAAALGHEVRYVRCRRTNKLVRLGNALTSPLFTFDSAGRAVPDVELVGGVIAGDAIAARWMPSNERGRARLARQCSVDLGAQSLFNTLREFGPELRRLFSVR
jgi:hypothetical protein